MFNSREEMIETAKRFTKQHGFNLVIGHSTKKHGEFARCWLVCELGGEYRNRHRLQPEDRKRKRESRKTNCPFKLLGSKRRHETQWILSIKDGRHNHDPITRSGNENVGESDYPELEDALYRWHKDTLLQNNDAAVHANTLKAKALELWHSIRQYQNFEPPEFGGEWVKAYRQRHGFHIKPVAKIQNKTSAPSSSAMSSVNAQRLVDATQHPNTSANVDPSLGDASREPQLPVAAVQLIHTLPSDAQTLITSIATHVRNEMRYNDASHDFTHVMRVLALSTKILATESQTSSLGYDGTAIVLSALLHGIADRRYIPPNADVENVIANTLLDRGCPDALALKVQMITRNSSWSAEQANPRMNRAVVSQHPELAVVQDADRLDSIGAIGIARTFAYGGAKTAHTNKESETESGLEEALGHFEEKLEKFEGMMKVRIASIDVITIMPGSRMLTRVRPIQGEEWREHGQRDLPCSSSGGRRRWDCLVRVSDSYHLKRSLLGWLPTTFIQASTEAHPLHMLVICRYRPSFASSYGSTSTIVDLESKT